MTNGKYKVRILWTKGLLLIRYDVTTELDAATLLLLLFLKGPANHRYGYFSFMTINFKRSNPQYPHNFEWLLHFLLDQRLPAINFRIKFLTAYYIQTKANFRSDIYSFHFHHPKSYCKHKSDKCKRKAEGKQQFCSNVSFSFLLGLFAFRLVKSHKILPFCEGWKNKFLVFGLYGLCRM